MTGDPSGALMTIGSVSRATGIPTNTIRTWERRYGFPEPERTDSGQRVYRPEVVPHLRLVSEALEAGHRPRQVLSMDLTDLQALLGSANVPVISGPEEVPEVWKAAVFRLDGPALDSSLRQECARMGALRFIIERVGPFLSWVGQSWVDGEVEVHQEHFASDHVRAVLDSSWRSLAPVTRPSVVCATLPGEEHDLGVHMAAVAVASGGRRPLVLPGATPVLEIAASVEATGSKLVAISLSSNATSPDFKKNLVALRAALPDRVKIWVGGAGAPHGVEGVEVAGDLSRLARIA